MTDPERLLRNPPSSLGLLLLRASAEEKPSAAARRRTAKAAAAAATGVAVTSASAAATAAGVQVAAVSGSTAPLGAALAVGTVAKWFAVGALGGVLAAPLVRVVSTPHAAKHEQPPPAPATQPGASHRLGTGPTGAARAAKTTPATTLTDNPSEREPPTHAPARSAQSLAPSPADAAKPETLTPATGALLAAEVAFIDQGRAALQRGTFTEALALLAPYESRFPRQQLLTEVLFLRMEAFGRSGDTARARSLAARVITRGIAGPQAARAREVLGR